MLKIYYQQNLSYNYPNELEIRIIINNPTKTNENIRLIKWLRKEYYRFDLLLTKINHNIDKKKNIRKR